MKHVHLYMVAYNSSWKPHQSCVFKTLHHNNPPSFLQNSRCLFYTHLHENLRANVFSPTYKIILYHDICLLLTTQLPFLWCTRVFCHDFCQYNCNFPLQYISFVYFCGKKYLKFSQSNWITQNDMSFS